MSKKKKKKWFKAGEPLGWDKNDTMNKRRKIALRNRDGDELKTARALQALANVTKDKETKVKAGADAKYFFKLHQGGKK